MAQNQQIQIKFVAAEDPLMLHVSSDDNSEFRFWLTRRFVKLIWPSIVGSLEQTPAIQTQASPEAKKEIFPLSTKKRSLIWTSKRLITKQRMKRPLGRRRFF